MTDTTVDGTAPTEPDSKQATMALVMSTFAFTVCFACWVINGVLIAYLVNNKIFAFSTSQTSWLLALPILTGAISRVPLGLMTDIYGGRTINFVLMLITAVPLFLVSYATAYGEFLVASLGFGLAGGGFAVGIGYVAAWFKKENQGTALGIFGMGNAGAAATTLAAPTLLVWLTNDGSDPEQWRRLPQMYAGLLVVTAIAFVVLTRSRTGEASQNQSLGDRLAPLYNIRVWRFGLYYFLVFGAFVSIAQWLVPYSVNVYQISIIQAGLLASLFSQPSGVIRAFGGWLSDRFGARSVMYWVFMSCAISFTILAIPRMVIDSPGRGIVANAPGQVTNVTNDAVNVGDQTYKLTPLIGKTPAELDTGNTFLPQVTKWHEPAVTVGQQVKKKELVARGVTNIFYPANLWVFGFFVLVIGVATGIGKAGVFKFIPEYFPQNVGSVGGMVGLLGAMGGFIMPPLFGWALEATGVWASCWIILAILSVICLIWMQRVVSKILASEAPELSNMIDFRPRTRLTVAVAEVHESKTVEGLLRNIPIFDNLGRAELTSLTEIGNYDTAEAGRTLFKEGDPGDTAYVVLLGEIDVVRSDDEGHDVVIATLGAGEVFGELALIDGEPRSASAVAKVESQLFSIGRDDFIRLMSSSPRFLGDFMVGMTGRIRQTNAAFFEAMMQQERLRNEGEIERHRMISQMVTGVAHEINTPIGIATHAASIIADDLRPDRIEAIAKDEKAGRRLADVAEAAQLAQDNIVRADALIKSFKNLSVQQISESRETLDLAAYTEEVVGLYRMKAEAAHLEVETTSDVNGEAASWVGYPGLYSQLILNLITNADAHAYPDNTPGKIEVTLSDAGDRFQLLVRDFGLGIPAADQESVWEPFFTTARDKGGTGLGLPIVRNIVTTSLHGDIELASTEGEGTTITIKIPKIVPSEDDGAASSEAAQ